MSTSYICDITGEKVTYEDKGSKTVKQANVVLNGVPVSLELIVKIDAFNGATETHIAPVVWPEVYKKVKQWIIQNYG